MPGAAELKDPKTRIDFTQSNPKRRGTAAFDRYEKYKKAKSVQEALEAGAIVGDLAHDFDKGFLKLASRTQGNAKRSMALLLQPRAPAAGRGSSSSSVIEAETKRRRTAAGSDPEVKPPEAASSSSSGFPEASTPAAAASTSDLGPTAAAAALPETSCGQPPAAQDPASSSLLPSSPPTFLLPLPLPSTPRTLPPTTLDSTPPAAAWSCQVLDRGRASLLSAEEDTATEPDVMEAMDQLQPATEDKTAEPDVLEEQLGLDLEAGHSLPLLEQTVLLDDLPDITLRARFALVVVKAEPNEGPEAADAAGGHALPVGQPEAPASPVSHEARVQFEEAQAASYESHRKDRKQREERDSELIRQGDLQPIELLYEGFTSVAYNSGVILTWLEMAEHRVMLFEFLKLGSSMCKWYGDAAEAFYMSKRLELSALMENEAADMDGKALTLFLETEMARMKEELFSMPEKGRFAPKIFAESAPAPINGCVQLD